VRLDHLLSKEHSTRQARTRSGCQLMGGTLTIRQALRAAGPKYCSSERGTGRWSREVCRARCWVLREWALRPSLSSRRWWGSLVCPSGSSGFDQPSNRRVVCLVGVVADDRCFRLLFENCTVDASICGQVSKGARWMPRHQEPMKDVGGRDRPRGAVNRAVIRGCPNGETRQSSWAVTRT
jgi:hypothetical protein